MLQNKSASSGNGTQGLRGMAKKPSGQFSKKESAQRMRSALLGARLVPAKKNTESRGAVKRKRKAKYS
jgi:hypothetical protein